MTRHALAAILVAAILASSIPRPWLDPALALAALFVLAAARAVAWIARPREFHFAFPMIPLACATAWGVGQLAAGSTAGPAATRLAVLVWLGNLVAFCLAAQLDRRFADVLLYLAFALCVISVILHYGGSAGWGPFANRDHFAAFLELLLPVALVEMSGGGPRALRFALIAAAMFAATIACASRAGAILATAEIVIVAAAAVSRRRLPAAAAVFALLAAAFVAAAGGASLWHRLQDRDLFAGRSAIAASTGAMISARPWTGFGLGTFRAVYPGYASVDFGAVVNHAHNDWLEWAADGGVPFTLLLISIAVWTLRKVRRALWGVGAVAVFVHSLVDFPLQKPAVELWLFALLGVLAAASNERPD